MADHTPTVYRINQHQCLSIGHELAALCRRCDSPLLFNWHRRLCIPSSATMNSPQPKPWTAVLSLQTLLYRILLYNWPISSSLYESRIVTEQPVSFLYLFGWLRLHLRIRLRRGLSRRGISGEGLPGMVLQWEIPILRPYTSLRLRDSPPKGFHNGVTMETSHVTILTAKSPYTTRNHPYHRYRKLPYWHQTGVYILLPRTIYAKLMDLISEKLRDKIF